MNKRQPEHAYRFDATALVVIVVMVLAFLAGREAAIRLLVWVYALIGVVVAIAVSLMAGGASGQARVEVQFSGAASDSSSAPVRALRYLVLAIWAALSALSFLYLVWHGQYLYIVPFLSLSVFVLPDTSQLVADEYVRQVLARGAALAGALALAFGLIVIIFYRPVPLELVSSMLGVYMVAIEWAAYRELR